MLKFEPYSITALKKVLPYIKNNRSLCSNISAGFLFMWNEGVDMRFCVWKDTFVVRQNIGEQPAFTYPIGADPDGMIDELKRYAYNNHLPLRFYAVDEPTLEKIKADERLKPAKWAYERRWSDYIYSFEEARTFKGKKFSGQRNHINKFKKNYGEPSVRFLTAGDKRKVFEMLDEYQAIHRDMGAMEKMEFEQTKNLVEVYEELGLYAAGLFVGDGIAAFSIGEIVGETFVIHVEKALLRYEGAYPVMYSGFMNLIGARAEQGLQYVNREDDSGDAGLRISKTQYHPIKMADKYLVHVHSPALRLLPDVVYSAGDVVLTDIREGDKRAYMKLNTDVKNNRYWGYDYREDMSIIGEVNEDTFYDSVMNDMQSGDSVNLAVRLAEDGEMIGEVVIWNFSSDGFAEVGCRIFPEYQGKGYGKNAFGAAVGFAEGVLKLKIYARCYHENLPSYKMIASNGFSVRRKDDKFYYFERDRIGAMRSVAG